MPDTCPVLSDQEREASEIIEQAQRAMMEKVHLAVTEAAETVREQFLAAGIEFESPPKDYFDAVVHQRMYLTICGASIDTYEGGDASTAIELIRNQQMIANHYWGSAIAVTPRAP